MSISVVFNINSGPNTDFVLVFRHKFVELLEHLYELSTTTPSIMVFNTASSSSTSSNVYSEVRFVDQAQLDTYLADPRNFKTLVESLNSTDEVVTWCNLHNTTLSISIVENSTYTDGLLSTANLADMLDQLQMFS